MTKRTLVFLCIMILAFCFSGCANRSVISKQQDKKQPQITIVATSFPPYDFAREITKENAQVIMLLPPGAEIHSYEPTPKDIITIQNCDLFLYVGGENDVWVDDVLQSMGGDAPQTFKLMDCVDPQQERITEGMQDFPAKNQETPEYDQHVWTSPKNVVKIVEKMASAIESLDSVHRTAFEQNAASYLTKIHELDQDYQETVTQAARKTIIVGDRFPFQYLADAYGLTYYAAFPSCGANAEPAAATVAFLIDKVKEDHIPVIFYIEFSNHQIANSIAESTGTKTMLLHSCHNVTKEEMEQGASYLSLMQHNLDALKIALN